MDEKRQNEPNYDYCERMAREIPAEILVELIFAALRDQCRRSKTKTFQGELSKLLHYGNGVRMALERMYLGDNNND